MTMYRATRLGDGAVCIGYGDDLGVLTALVEGDAKVEPGWSDVWTITRDDGIEVGLYDEDGWMWLEES